MMIVHVQIQVKPDALEAFRQATIANASESVKEPGIAHFDFLQHADDPTRFLLVEIYRTPEAALDHKKTPHYETWRDTVAGMMAEPRSSVKYSNIFPEDHGF